MTYNVGKLIKIEVDNDSNKMFIVMEITDNFFKSKILHDKNVSDILEIHGKDVMIVSSKGKYI